MSSLDITTATPESTAKYSFELESTSLECIKSNREIKEQLLQYNLDAGLDILRFRLIGQISGQAEENYLEVLRDFFSSSLVLSTLETIGEPTVPIDLHAQSLGLDVMNMEFFDRFTEMGIVGPGGKIRGCFDDTFDGIVVGDLLREYLLNENSENASVYSESEKNEFIFHLFRIFAVGGSLCQPETSMDRYLAITKAFYKELVTVFKDSKTSTVKVAGRVFLVNSVSGVDLYKENVDSPHNRFYAVIDPIKKSVTVIRNNFKKFW